MKVLRKIIASIATLSFLFTITCANLSLRVKAETVGSLIYSEQFETTPGSGVSTTDNVWNHTKFWVQPRSQYVSGGISAAMGNALNVQAGDGSGNAVTGWTVDLLGSKDTGSGGVSLTAGSTYCLTFLLKATDITNFVLKLNGGSSYININPVTGASLDGNSIPYTATDAGGYLRLTVPFTATGQNMGLLIAMNANTASANFMIDDFRLYTGSSIPSVVSVNCVGTEGFEKANTSGNADNDFLFHNTPFWADADSAYDRSAPINGNASYQIHIPTSKSWSDVFGCKPSSQGGLTLAAGATYTLAFKMKATGLSNLLLKFYKDASYGSYDYINFNPDTGENLDGNSMPYTVKKVGDYLYMEVPFTAGFSDFAFHIAANSASDSASLTVDDFMVINGNVPSYDKPGAAQQQLSTGFEDGLGSFRTNWIGAVPNASPIGTSDSVINGRLSVMGGWTSATTGDDWSGILQTPPDFSVDSSAAYTVKYRYHIKKDSNHFFYLELNGPSDGSSFRYIRFTSSGVTEVSDGVIAASVQHQTGYDEMSVTFQPASGVTYSGGILLGSDGGGMIAVDDFTVNAGLDSPALSAVSVNTQNQIVLTQNFENDSLYPLTGEQRIDKPEQVMGKLTIDPALVIDGATSFVGTATSNGTDNDWGCVLKTVDGTFTPKNKTIYTVRFRYNIKQDPKDFFYIEMSAAGGTDRYIHFNSSGFVGGGSGIVSQSITQDAAGKIMTISFLTNDTSTYTGLLLGYNGGGSIVVDDLSITEGYDTSALPSAVKTSVQAGTLYYANDFEDGGGTYLYAQNQKNFGTSIDSNMSEKINGIYSMKLYSQNDWSENLFTQYGAGKDLKPNTKYTVTFRFKSLGGTGNLDFMVKPNDGNAKNMDLYQAISLDGKARAFTYNGQAFYNGIQRLEVRDSGKGYYDVSATFTTLNRSDYRVVLGLCGSAAITVDDLNVYTGASAPASGEATAVPENTPNQAVLTQNFENDSLSPLTGEQRSDKPEQVMGKLTIDPALVIDGATSFVGTASSNGTDNDWGCVLKTMDGTFTPKNKTIYTVRFRYNIKQDPKDFFYIEMPATGGTDRFIHFNSSGFVGGGSGIVSQSITQDAASKIMTVSFLTNDASAYTGLLLGYNGGGSIVVDDFSITEGYATSALPAAVKTSVQTGTLYYANDFEDGVAGTYLYPQNQKNFGTVIDGSMSEKIDGLYSMKLYSQNDWSENLYTQYGIGKDLKPNTQYTVTFRFKPLGGTGNLDFMVKPNDGNVKNMDLYQAISLDGKAQGFTYNGMPFYNGIQRMDVKDSGKGYFDVSATFTTLNRSDYRVVLGLCGSGTVTVDDLNVYIGATAPAIGEATAVEVPIFPFGTPTEAFAQPDIDNPKTRGTPYADSKLFLFVTSFGILTISLIVKTKKRYRVKR